MWEAASLAGIYKLNNLIAIVDANRLGQSQATAFGHDIGVYRKRFEAFGWRVEDIDGHDLEEISEVLGGVGLNDQPLAIIAKTYKGAGRFLFAGQGRLAWQTVEQGRSRQGHRRTSADRQIRHRCADSRAEPIAGAEASRACAVIPPLSYKTRRFSCDA